MAYQHRLFIRLASLEKAHVVGNPFTGEIEVMLGQKPLRDGSPYSGFVPAPALIAAYLGAVDGLLEPTSAVIDGGSVSHRRALDLRDVHEGQNRVIRSMRIDDGSIDVELEYYEEDLEETADEATGFVIVQVHLGRGPGEERFNRKLNESQCWEIMLAAREMGIRLARWRADRRHGYAGERPMAFARQNMSLIADGAAKAAAAAAIACSAAVPAAAPENDNASSGASGFPTRPEHGSFSTLAHFPDPGRAGLAAIMNETEAAE